MLKAVPGTLLFRTWDEGLRLFRQIARRVAFHAIGVMPEHAHVSTARADQDLAIATVMRAYALERNALRGTSGPVFAPTGPPAPVADRRHLETLRRYIHRNPVTDGLVPDPLAWPLSLHRDLCGFAVPQFCRTIRDPAAFHAEASADARLNQAATPLPAAPAERGGRAATPAEVRAAVSALTRTTAAGLRRPGPARDLLLGALRRLTCLSAPEIAAFAGVGRATAYRHPGVPDALLDLVASVLADSRFPLLHDGDLRTLPTWSFYRGYR